MKKTISLKKQEATSPRVHSKNGVGLMPPALGLPFVDNRPVQKKQNQTGMPDNLKSGIENLSGIDMSDVKVYYNSSQPAQLNAHAYAQGNQIHIAPGQQKHLPHEAWHVVQQKQGRVKATKQLKGKVNINDDAGLEKEADVMGAKALSGSSEKETPHIIANTAIQNAIVQNKKRWTPQQRAQSEKFWKHKAAREKRKEDALTSFTEGMEKDHGIIITREQAMILSAQGYSRQELAAMNARLPIAQLITLCKAGFSRWAVTKALAGEFTLADFGIWMATGSPPTNLVNEFLQIAGEPRWIEANHAAAKAKGAQLVNKNKGKIGAKLGVDISRASGGDFVLTKDNYTIACVFLSVRDAMEAPYNLEPSLKELIRLRKAKVRSEHAIQNGNQIFFKGDPTDSTVVHELTHFYGEQEKFIKNFCFGKADGINEGFTEFFARHAEAPSEMRVRTVYAKEVAAVAFMAHYIGWGILKDAYFTGNVWRLKSEYEARIGAKWTPEEEERITENPSVKK